MTQKPKKIVLIAAVILLIAVIAGTTVAYFTSSKSLINTFTMGSVDISLSEDVTEITDTSSGAVLYAGGTETTDSSSIVTGANFKAYPGICFHKEPTITVADGSESAYLAEQIVIQADFEASESYSNTLESLYGITGSSDYYKLLGSKGLVEGGIFTAFNDPAQAPAAVSIDNVEYYAVKKTAADPAAYALTSTSSEAYAYVRVQYDADQKEYTVSVIYKDAVEANGSVESFKGLRISEKLKSNDTWFTAVTVTVKAYGIQQVGFEGALKAFAFDTTNVSSFANFAD